MRYGTCYFMDSLAAVTYYRKYGLTRADVKAKIDAGEIHIGRPPVKEGERAHLDYQNGRYFIEDAE